MKSPKDKQVIKWYFEDLKGLRKLGYMQVIMNFEFQKFSDKQYQLVPFIIWSLYVNLLLYSIFKKMLLIKQNMNLSTVSCNVCHKWPHIKESNKNICFLIIWLWTIGPNVKPRLQPELVKKHNHWLFIELLHIQYNKLMKHIIIGLMEDNSSQRIWSIQEKK